MKKNILFMLFGLFTLVSCEKEIFSDSDKMKFQRKILEMDPQAFIIYSESQQIVGNGFYIYK